MTTIGSAPTPSTSEGRAVVVSATGAVNVPSAAASRSGGRACAAVARQTLLELSEGVRLWRGVRTRWKTSRRSDKLCGVRPRFGWIDTLECRDPVPFLRRPCEVRKHTRGGRKPNSRAGYLGEGEGQESIGSPHVVTHAGASTDAQPDQDSEVESSCKRPLGVTRRSLRQLNGKRGRGIERCFC
jgi:hypothetical protein